MDTAGERLAAQRQQGQQGQPEAAPAGPSEKEEEEGDWQEGELAGASSDAEQSGGG